MSQQELAAQCRSQPGSIDLQRADVNPRQHRARWHRLAFVRHDFSQCAAGLEPKVGAAGCFEPARESSCDLVIRLQDHRRRLDPKRWGRGRFWPRGGPR